MVPKLKAEEQLINAPGAAFSDPSCGNMLVWEDFVWRLARAGLVDFVDEVIETTGVFFVPKKNGKQRMVLDGCRSNCWFVRPEGVSLCTGPSLANIELGGKDVLYIGQADIANAFYHIGLPAALRPFFGLKKVRRARVPRGLLHLVGSCSSQAIHPRLCVTPMGFSRAFWLCQQIHHRAVRSIGPGRQNRLRDRKPWQPGENLYHLEYVDKFVAFSSSETQTRDAVLSVVNKLERLNLPMHEVEHCCGGKLMAGQVLYGPLREGFEDSPCYSAHPPDRTCCGPRP